MADYVFELLTEEIPAWMLDTATRTLHERLSRIASDLSVPDPETAERLTNSLPVNAALGLLDYYEVVGFAKERLAAMQAAA